MEAQDELVPVHPQIRDGIDHGGGSSKHAFESSRFREQNHRDLCGLVALNGPMNETPDRFTE
jgi:hypothetical protein